MNSIDMFRFEKAEPIAFFDKEVTACGDLYPHHAAYGKLPTCSSCGSETKTKYSTQCVNWSGIRDHLIRLTAHFTDFYASDLLYQLDTIQRDLENGEVKPEGYFFGFRSMGVHFGDYIALAKDHRELENTYRAIWRLTIDISSNKHVEMSLHRVSYNAWGRV